MKLFLHILVLFSFVFVFIGNLNSYIFHESYCSSVSKMKYKNRYYSDSRYELIDMGMRPCKKCRP